MVLDITEVLDNVEDKEQDIKIEAGTVAGTMHQILSMLLTVLDKIGALDQEMKI